MQLATVINVAQRGQSVTASEFKKRKREVVFLRISLSGRPSHKMSNAVVATARELEDALLPLRLKIVGGGAADPAKPERFGLLVDMYPDMGVHTQSRKSKKLDANKRHQLEAFVSTEQNIEHFRRCFGIAGMSVLTHTPQKHVGLG